MLLMGKSNTNGHYSYVICYWLVVWNMTFYDFPYIGNFIIPTDELIYFFQSPPNRWPDAKFMELNGYIMGIYMESWIYDQPYIDLGVSENQVPNTW